MAESFLSQDWYRVAMLQPRLRAHVELHRQVFRGGIWYVAQDRQGGKYHQVSPAANYMLNLMDGRRSLHSIWEAACERFQDDPPTQGEVIQLLAQLHRADLIAADTLPDVSELARRADTQSRRALMTRVRNPLALKLPLIDPDRFLTATAWLLRPIFTPVGFALWLGLVLWGATLVVLNWPELTGGLADRVLTAQNLILIAIAYPLIKAIHELGHGYATKVWGGQVHEMGLMFLVLVPLPYVDASSAATFPDKWRRMIVGGAGIMVELALAALAAIFWVYSEPGLARAFAFNVMLIGGVSTLLFNGNPLLRFDGYFVLADALEIPNLGNRANKYVLYLIERYGFGNVKAESPVSARGERFWFVVYAVAAFFYRIFIAIVISLFIATKLFFLGVALAIWALWNAFAWPLVKGAYFLWRSPRLRTRRRRAFGVTGAALGALTALIFLVPFPYASVAEGVVWLDEDRFLRAEAPGFVETIMGEDGPVTEVSGGDVVLAMDDPVLASQSALLTARKREIDLRLAAVVALDPVQENLLRNQAETLDAQIERLNARSDALVLRVPRDGRAIMQKSDRLEGRLLPQGETVGYLLDGSNVVVRVAVADTSADLVRSRTEGVSLRFARDLDTILDASILREVPGGEARLPSKGLSSDAGGPFAIDPTDPEGLRALSVAFQFDVSPVDSVPVQLVGERAYVRFDHGSEVLAPRIWRVIRQIFLSRFNV